MYEEIIKKLNIEMDKLNKQIAKITKTYEKSKKDILKDFDKDIEDLENQLETKKRERKQKLIDLKVEFDKQIGTIKPYLRHINRRLTMNKAYQKKINEMELPRTLR